MATAFLHFLCACCGYSGCPLYQISLRMQPATKTARFTARTHLFAHSFPPAQSGNSAHSFFLTCTKNTELTNSHFARTFSFALSDNSLQNPAGASRLNSKSITHRKLHSGQSRYETGGMENVSHSLPHQSQATQFQLQLRRSPRTGTLRAQRRLPRRIFGGRS